MSRLNLEQLARRPDLERYLKELGEPTRLGEALTIVGHPFAEPFSNDDLIELALEYGLPTSQIADTRKAIDATGFTTRYFSFLPGQETDIGRSLERTADIGAILLKETLKAKGWEDGFDIFIDTSAFLPTTINGMILDRLGINRVYSRSYRYACAGAVGAFIDCLSDPSLQDARIVIGALEPLSLVLDQSQFLSPSTVTFPSIFGDANTFLAFSPSHFHLENKRILIQPDGGVIKLETLYNFSETPSEPLSIPEHYRFANQGEKIFHHSPYGAFLEVPSPVNGASVSMDGMATGFFFGDKTTGVIIDLLKENGNMDMLKTLGHKNIIMHPASKPVVDRIAKLLYRGKYKYLEAPALPFLMDKARHSNGSSATTLNRWRYMIENNMIDPQLPMLWIAPGIGSAIAGAIGWINP